MRNRRDILRRCGIRLCFVHEGRQRIYRMRQFLKTAILIVAVLVAVTLAAMAQAPAPNPQDAKYQSKGEQDRAYTFPGTAEMIPYHIYVPQKWDKTTKLPLIIVTHGASQPSTAPFMR